MSVLVPQYYSKFSCIADKCLHNCCIGWEIDIDSHSMEVYKGLEGSIGDKIRNSIGCDGGQYHFRLDSDDRCPMLNRSGLCEIIENFGDGALCNICADHPRFRNFFTSHTEMGLGMCCEEAVRIILEETVPFSLNNGSFSTSENIYTVEEIEFFKMRERLFGILTDRQKELKHRIKDIINEFSVSFPKASASEWERVYRSLERLDNSWDFCLDLLHNCEKTQYSFFDDKAWQIVLENLICYFLFRHLPDGIESGNYNTYISFAILSCMIIAAIFLNCKDKTFDVFKDICRMYSSEIEYSDENIDEILFEIDSFA
ncbi:MAG: flagellin lysine-N-methylase [Clostridia bacterium]|nr:flagellin lysine-N-methylase [Clostridia bacterium]